jgi:hypothetical protein
VAPSGNGDPSVILEDIGTLEVKALHRSLTAYCYATLKVHLISDEDELKDEALRVGCEEIKEMKLRRCAYLYDLQKRSHK